MTNISSKIFEMFKNLKSDAVPRPPRPSKDPQPEVTEDDEEIIDTNGPEEILVESDEETKKSEKRSRFKKTFFKPSKKDGKGAKLGTSNINTQATGNVINIVSSKNLRWGNDYYMGPTNMKSKTPEYEEEEPEEHIEKTNLIQLVLEAKIRPEHEYIDYISKNLGKTWQTFFRTLGFTKGAIETMEIDTKSYGVSEARYKLLLQWAENDDDGTLGRLSTLLWEGGERQIVKDLALIYKKSKTKK